MSFQKIMLLALFCGAFVFPSFSQEAFILSTSRTDNTFEVNDFMSFNVEALQTGTAEFRIRHASNVAPLETGVIEVEAGKTYNIFFSLAYEGTVWFEMRMGNQAAVTSASFAPFDIEAREKAPEDFDEFWTNARAELDQVPIAPRLQFHSSSNYSDTYTIDLGMIDNRRVYGYISLPKTSGSYPAVLTLPPFGSRPDLVKPEQEITERIGAISMTISIHDAPLDENVPSPYQPDNLANPKENYFRYAILSSLRAIDYIDTRTDFNGSLAVTGISQGGGLAIMTAGLDERVDLLVFSNPTHAEHQGTRYGRASGFPYYLEQTNQAYPGDLAQYEQTAQAIKYYDAIYFANRYEGPSLAIVGYNDQVCPAATTFAAFNQLKGAKILFHATQLGHQHPVEYWKGRRDAFRRFLDVPTEPPFPYARKTKGYYIDAGENNSTQIDENYELKGVALVNEDSLTQAVEWIQIEGNGRAVFRQADQLNTTVSFTDTGRYVLALRVRDNSKLLRTGNFYSLMDRIEIDVEAAVESVFEVDCPSNSEVYATRDSAVVKWELPQLIATSCDNQNPNIRQVSGPSWGSTLEVGTYEIEYLVQDACGQAANCLFEVKVLADTTRVFEIKCPTDLEVIARGESAVVQWELPQLVETSCDDQSIQIQQLQGQLSGSTFEVGEYEIEYLVQDACGQAANCLFEIKVLADTTRVFEIKCPTDLEVIARGESALVQWELPQLVETSCDDQSIQIQ
ncbi:MAG: acetylxylan esterase, partial [Bacteroidota bacterium]